MPHACPLIRLLTHPTYTYTHTLSCRSTHTHTLFTPTSTHPSHSHPIPLPRTQVRVRASAPGGNRGGKDLACLNRIPFPPPPQPNASFSVVGVGQRCLEGQLVNITARRSRVLIDTPEAQACWTRCSNEGFPVPFHFSVAAGGTGCWCCGATCTLIRDPGVIVRVYMRLYDRPCVCVTLHAVAREVKAPSSPPAHPPTLQPPATVLRRDCRGKHGGPDHLAIGLTDVRAHDDGANAGAEMTCSLIHSTPHRSQCSRLRRLSSHPKPLLCIQSTNSGPRRSPPNDPPSRPRRPRRR